MLLLFVTIFPSYLNVGYMEKNVIGVSH